MELELTPLGKQKALHASGHDPRSSVLALLYENNGMSLEELADELRTSTEKTVRIVRSLMNAGLVRKV